MFDKGMISLASYVGAISLSSAIGYGVILSATWLLPVALIPGTWEQSDAPWTEGMA